MERSGAGLGGAAQALAHGLDGRGVLLDLHFPGDGMANIQYADGHVGNVKYPTLYKPNGTWWASFYNVQPWMEKGMR